MPHISAPAHPLIHAFLLQRKEFQCIQKLIVENRERGAELLKNLVALSEFSSPKKQYRLVESVTDILEVMHDTDLVGIFPVETIEWSIDSSSTKNLIFTLKKGMKMAEDTLLSWLTEHGFRAQKSDEEHTFFRQGDTISIQTRKGTLLVNFFGTTIETLYLSGKEQEEWTLFATHES